MALGDYDNNKKKYYEPILYSPYGTSNTDGVDPSALSYQFYNGLLKISISPMLPNAKPNDKQIWDRDNAVSVWLTHVKAKMFCDEIKYVLAHPDECNNGGVPTGTDGLISFSSGKELGVSTPCLIIRKIDPESGSVQSVYAYQFKDKHYKAVRNFNPDSPTEYDSVNYPNLEIENLITILEDYYKSTSGAIAYSVMNGMKYDIHRNNTKMALIMDKLGIEKPEYGNGNSGGGRSFFSSNQGSGNKNNGEFTGMNPPVTRSTTLEQLEGEME